MMTQYRPRTERLQRWCGLVVAIVMSGLAVTYASAVPPFGDEMYHPNRIFLTKADVQNLQHVVIESTDAPESALIEGMYAGYTRAWGQRARTARNRIKQIRDEARGLGPDGHKTIRPQMDSVYAEFRLDARSLEAEFIENVKKVLTEEQQIRFPKFERDRRRHNWLRRHGQIAGERADIVDLVDKLRMSDEARTAITPTLDEYSNEMDQPLIDREVVLLDSNKRLDAIRKGESNEDGEMLYRQVLLRRRAIRDVNTRYADIVQSELPEAYALEFRDAYNHSSYPRIYAKSQADNYLYKVFRLQDLDDEQMNKIDLLEANYRAENQVIIQRLVAAQHKRDEQVPMSFKMAGKSGAKGGSPAGGSQGGSVAQAEIAADVASRGNANAINAERDLWSQRRDLDSQFISSVYDVLTPGQQEQVPKTETRPQPGGRPRGRLEDTRNDNGGG